MQSVYNFQFANRKQRRWFVIAITIIALLFFVWVLGNGLYRIYDTYKERKAAEKSTVVINRPAVKSNYSIDTVVKTKLFGEQKKKVVIKRPPVAPETKLDLAIEGLLSANNEVIARAIISVKKKKGGLYKVGDEIKGAKNVVVEEIRENGVLLNRNGIIENLAFIKKTVSGNRSITNFSPVRTPTSSRVSRNSATNANRSRAPSNRTPQKNDSKRRAIKRPNFKGLDAAIERELEAALDDLERD